MECTVSGLGSKTSTRVDNPTSPLKFPNHVLVLCFPNLRAYFQPNFKLI